MSRHAALAALAALLALVSALSSCSSGDARHLFILSGQSNMARMNPEAGFLPEAGKLLPDSRIDHIRIAAPGRPIRNWLDDWDTMATQAGLDPALVRLQDQQPGSPCFKPIIDKAKRKLHPPPDSITFVWMQGESDARGGAEEIYRQALTSLIAKLRRDLAAPDMKVVIARISDFGLKHPGGGAWPGWSAVRRAQQRVVAADRLAAMVDTDDCNGPDNGLHYPPEGYELMGRRMARQAAALIKGDKPDPAGRPQP